MAKLVSPPEAARLIGVHPEQVREWMRREDDPLPSVPVGSTSKHRRVIADTIPDWLAREADRDRARTKNPRR